jgi:hypothetical protein
MTMIIDGTNGLTFNNSTTQASAGCVLQVVQAVKNDTFTLASSSLVAITGLSASITPKFSTSKILVTLSFYAGGGSAGYDTAYVLYKNGSALTGATGAASGSRLSATAAGLSRSIYEQSSLSINYLDSPATTSSTTYSLYGLCNGTTYINKEEFDSNDVNGPRSISTITLMEIAG